MPVQPKITKQDVANTIFDTLKGWERNRQYEISLVTPLLIRIRYKEFADGPPRYFDVKVSEPY